MPDDKQWVSVQERFTKACPLFPNGLWERKVGDGEWQFVAENPPILFLDEMATTITRTTRELTAANEGE